MKKKVFYFGGLMMAAIVLLFACTKKPDGPSTSDVTVNNYFSVQNATLVNNDMPEPTSTTILDVQMNQSVIPGGSSFVTLNSPVGITKVMVGVRDEYGYYELVPNSRTQTVNFTMVINQNIDLGEGDAFPVVIAIIDDSGNVSEIWEHEIKLIEVGTGTLQVSLSFNQAKDVDLHLIEPAYNDEYGEPASFYDRHIYYGNHLSTNGGELDLDSNAGCSIDNINNENITYGEETYVEPGTYKVYVDMWSNCSPQDAPTTYTVTVFYSGALIASKSGVFEADAPSTHNPISEQYVEENEPFLSFTIGNRGQQRVKTFEPLPLTESAKEKLSME